jgi:hypothetical protein
VVNSHFVLVLVTNDNQCAKCNAHAVASVNFIARRHHHQTVVDIWNVNVNQDIHDIMIIQEIQDVYQVMNVHKVNVVKTNIGMNVDQAVAKISVAQQWVTAVPEPLLPILLHPCDHSVLNQDAVHQCALTHVNQDVNVILDLFVVTMDSVFIPKSVSLTNNVHQVNITINVQVFVMNFIAALILVAVFHLTKFVTSL